MTRHETENLGSYVALALDAGVTPAELSETITHMAFYTGFGNATAASDAAAPVFAARGVSLDAFPPVSPDLLPLNEAAEAARDKLVSGLYCDVSTGVVDHPLEVPFLDP